MEDQDITSRTTNITGTATSATAGDLYGGYVSNGPIITHYVDTDRMTINGDLYRDAVGINGQCYHLPWDEDERSNDLGTKFTRQHTYTTVKIWDAVEERIKALEERIEQIEEALMIESAKNLDSLIENDRGGEE